MSNDKGQETNQASLNEEEGRLVQQKAYWRGKALEEAARWWERGWSDASDGTIPNMAATALNPVYADGYLKAAYLVHGIAEQNALVAWSVIQHREFDFQPDELESSETSHIDALEEIIELHQDNAANKIANKNTAHPRNKSRNRRRR